MRGSTPRTDVSFCPHRSMVGPQIVDLHTGVQFSLGALRFLLVGMVVVGQFLSSHSETSETFVCFEYARGVKR